MSNNPFGPGETGVTIKYGKGYESTWATFKGSPSTVRSQVIEYFGFSAEETEGLTVAQVILNATNLAHAQGNLGAYLGATAIPSQESGRRQEASGNDPWQMAQSATADAPAPPRGEPSPAERLIAEFETVSDLERLKRLWAENQALFGDERVMTAWKARGRAIKTVASA